MPAAVYPCALRYFVSCPRAGVLQGLVLDSMLHVIDFAAHVYLRYIIPAPPPLALLLPVEILVKVPLEILRRVIEPDLLVHLINLLDILPLQLEVAFEVGLDPALGLAFRQNSSPMGIR